MRKIFEIAVEALAWLGPAEDDCDAALDKYADIGERAIKAGIKDYRSWDDRPSWFKPDPHKRLTKLKLSLAELAETEGLELFHPAIVPFSKRACWRQVWVLPETSICRNVRFLCGDKELNPEILGAATEFHSFAWFFQFSTHSNGE